MNLGSYLKFLRFYIMIERYLSFLLLFKCMLQLIKTGLEKRIYDEVMETAWSALWNVTGILKAETV